MRLISTSIFLKVLTVCAFIPTTGNLAYAQGKAKVTALKCEYLVNPLGVDVTQPRLSWQMQDAAQGAAQSAYQILVSKDSVALAQLGNAAVWNSGKVQSSQRLVGYAGGALEPFTAYYWKVLTWNKAGQPLPASSIARFETGMMQRTNWRGTWISDGNSINARPAGYFRKEFNAAKKVRSARAYIAVGGLYELYLNGQKVGNHRLDPMYTRFDRRNLYLSYDVTSQLQNGTNAIGVLLGNGWYNHQSLAVWNFDRAPWRARPAFCLDLRVTYNDGSTEVITSDGSWKTHTGPLVSNSIYTGEQYDARLEMPGWNTAGFNDQNWHEVQLRAAPSQNIVSQLMEPIRNVEKVPARSVRKFNDTTYLFDLGRNIAGVSQIRLKGDSGTVVRLKHGERLYENGHVDLSNIDVYYRPKDGSDPFGTDVVTLSGKGTLEFMPKFNYKGFQYVEVTSSKPIKLSKEDLIGYFMHSDVQQVGQLNTSNPLVNRLWWATNNSYLSNLFGYPTDCPQREKNGWTGDGHFAIETGLYNYDAVTIYEKWLADHRDEQQPNGVLPDIIPTGGWGYGTANGTDWTSTIAIIPWTLYMFYGDSKPLADNYDNIKAYVNYVQSISPEGLTTFGRGDWVPVKSSSPLEYTSSVYYFVDANILAKAARLLGKQDDYSYYSKLANKIKEAINNKYLNKAAALYGSGLQTELSVALQWGIVPDELKARVAENLAKRVAADGMHLDVGVLGARAILNALSDNGQAETAYKLAAQNTYPSWGWWIVNGATTLYENWNIKAERDISLNHMMFGDVGGWFFKGLGGIKPDEAHPGFANVLLKPSFVSGLTHMEASHEGPYGIIRSAWKRSGTTIKYKVTIPANSTASVMLPLQAGQAAYLQGKAVAATLNISAGTYEFVIR
ncbi:family 78 glycoside hydrolase catalytic domain [Mucilaginibacter sp. Bleaf8]|uniref:alpha-L-rhamnosidase n=1 Tax=Mucilaginibacter sp. Bleaf8 TaxID=2834430 RepID=UPI001BD1259D|nr:alpha-L-rhamnosidase [Mucilaginibacter sp. Bleaf8]MBS7566502.1 family 78 glycoside hydrolase catalytic domain [Mucilaginibacter sp. Bleaf8]